jgi:hypothetical protein
MDTNAKMVAGLKERGIKISAEVERALLGMREHKGGGEEKARRGGNMRD